MIETFELEDPASGAHAIEAWKPLSIWLPAGSHAEAVVLAGVDASAGISSQGDPRPLLLRLTGPAWTAAAGGSALRVDVEGCTVTGAAHGDLSSEKVYARLEDRAALSYAESEQWSEQAAAVRADAQSIERELGQPFFAWLTEREGTDGRPIGVGGAMRLASPQTPEDAEALREQAAAFIAERFPAPAGPDPATVAGSAEYGTARAGFDSVHGSAATTAHTGWAAGVRDRAGSTGAPRPGDVAAGAEAGRGDVEAELAARAAGRGSRADATRAAADKGRADVAAEHERPFRDHAAERVPFVGDWLAGKLYGTAGNRAPDVAPGPAGEGSPPRRSGPDWGGP